MGERLRGYYRHPAVQARLLEFLGGVSIAEATARFVTTGGSSCNRTFEPLPLRDLWSAVDRDFELSRSLWDRDALIAHLDLEHVHFDRPWDTFARPERTFELQQPVADAIEARLRAHGIPALHMLTGRGHHWTWKIQRDSPTLAALAALEPLSASLRSSYQSPREPAGETVGVPLGAAHHGLGLVLEGLAHEVLRAVQGRTAIPVQATAVSVGPGPEGREIVSLDLSEYGDPLFARTIRVPFSVYLKGWREGMSSLPPRPLAPLAVVPIAPGMDWRAGLRHRRLERASDLAQRVSVSIPDGSAGTGRLVETYRTSPVAAFHSWYQATEPEPPERWPESYDRVDPGALPACAGAILAHPNDLALRPASLQLLVRLLMARGWHPRHVAGLVRSKLERDHGWLGTLHFFDAQVRADFYVRLFAGLLLLGVDRLVDLNCVSTQEKGMCPGIGCGWNLAELRDRLCRGGLSWAIGQ